VDHATKSPSDQQRGRSATQRSAPASAAAPIVDNRPEAIAQRELANAINHRSRVIAQGQLAGAMRQSLPVTSLRALSAALNHSPRVVVQRQQLGDMPGEPPSRHSAAHVVQQRGTVQLEGGVGEIGDRCEQQTPGGASHSSGTVQRLTGVKFTQWKGKKLAEIQNLPVPLRPEATALLDEIKNEPETQEAALDQEFTARIGKLVESKKRPTVGGIPDFAALPARPEHGTDATTEQFGNTSSKSGGGVLMRGVADQAELELFLSSVPSPDTSRDALKARKFNLEKYSYVRSDTSMRAFGGRAMGLLVDPNQVKDQVKMEDGRMSMLWEDGQTGKSTKPTTTADVKKTPEEVSTGFDALVTKQNEVKKIGKQSMGNWNEVEILTAKSNAYIGLFYAWPHQKHYDAVFTSSLKATIGELWHKVTGQTTLRIYLYKHRGNPERASDELETARAALGTPGASELILMETIPCGPRGGSAPLGLRGPSPSSSPTPNVGSSATAAAAASSSPTLGPPSSELRPSAASSSRPPSRPAETRFVEKEKVQLRSGGSGTVLADNGDGSYQVEVEGETKPRVLRSFQLKKL
jgi:hypothetical protein